MSKINLFGPWFTTSTTAADAASTTSDEEETDSPHSVEVKLERDSKLFILLFKRYYTNCSHHEYCSCFSIQADESDQETDGNFAQQPGTTSISSLNDEEANINDNNKNNNTNNNNQVLYGYYMD